MTQTITSAETSLNQVPAIFRLVKKTGAFVRKTRVLDMGGGKFNLTTKALAKLGVTSHVYDPYNRSEEHNDGVRCEFDFDPADVALCSNVLNVVREPSARQAIHHKIKSFVKPGGKVFFTVYEGDRSSRGRKTSKGWQAHRPTKSYVRELKREYSSVVRKGKLLICETPVPNWVTIKPGTKTTLMLANVTFDADGIHGRLVASGMGTTPERGRPLPMDLTYDGEGYVSGPRFTPSGHRIKGASCALILDGAVSAAYTH
jgi:hypothetical protein